MRANSPTRRYVDGANNRTALVAGGQAVFSFYKGNPSGKVMQFSAVQNGTAWTCHEYCPFEQGEDEFFDPLAFDKKATDQGAKTIEGKTYEGWHWFDTERSAGRFKALQTPDSRAVDPPSASSCVRQGLAVSRSARLGGEGEMRHDCS